MNVQVFWRVKQRVRNGTIVRSLTDVSYEVIEDDTGNVWVVHKNDIIFNQQTEHDAAYKRAMQIV